jgi:hypothetical protein
MSWLFTKSDQNVVAIFDIGNGSIGCSFAQLSHTDKPILLYTHREPITYLPHVTAQRLLETMLKLLKSVSSNVSQDAWKKYHHSVRHAYCIFSSPWFVSQTRILTYAKDKPFTVTQGLIDNIVKSDEQQFLAALNEGKYEKVFGSDLRLLEKKIIHTRLNGYEVTEPINKKARQLELTFFTSFMSELIIQNVEKVLQYYFHFKSVEYYSYALTAWTAIRDIFPHESDFLFLDITAETTDVMITEGGVLSQTVSFPIGRSMVLRKIVDTLMVPPEVALSFLNLYNKGETDQEFTEKISGIMDEAQTLWAQTFIQTLQKIKAYQLIPKKIFLTADADCSAVFIESLRQPMPAELDVPQNNFEVVFLGSSVVEPLAYSDDSEPLDAFIALESTFLNRIVV